MENDENKEYDLLLNDLLDVEIKDNIKDDEEEEYDISIEDQIRELLSSYDDDVFKIDNMKEVSEVVIDNNDNKMVILSNGINNPNNAFYIRNTLKEFFFNINDFTNYDKISTDIVDKIKKYNFFNNSNSNLSIVLIFKEYSFVIGVGFSRIYIHDDGIITLSHGEVKHVFEGNNKVSVDLIKNTKYDTILLLADEDPNIICDKVRVITRNTDKDKLMFDLQSDIVVIKDDE